MQKKIAVFALAASLLALTACGNTNSSVVSSVVPSVTSSESSAATTSKGTSATTTSAGTTSTTSAGTTSAGTTSTTSIPSSTSEAPKTGIQTITASGDYDIKAVITAVTTKGFVLDDGTGSLYVYVALDSAYKLGDFVAANVTVAPYFSIWEGTKVNSIAKADGTAPAIADETVMTAALAEQWKAAAGSKTEETAPFATSSNVPLTLTAKAQMDGTYPFFNVEGSDLKIEPSGLSSEFSIYSGVEYALNFYFGGYNSSKSFASIYVYAATPNYAAPTGVTVSGSAEVEVGASTQLAAAVAPVGANPLVTWASADEKIAKVDATGLVSGVAVGTVKITAASVADSTKIGEYSVTVKAAVPTSSLTKYDFSKIPDASTETAATGWGVFDATSMLAAFKNTTYIASGANVVASVETATKVQEANTTQGPKIQGLKLGTGTVAGVLAFTTTSDVAHLKMSVRAWSSTKFATITVNAGTAQTLVAADATVDRALDFTFTAGKTITINFSMYAIITSLELLSA